MKTIEIKELDKDKIVSTYGRYDLTIESGSGSKCLSTDGKEYIDFTAGIGVNSLGFSDDIWAEAVINQVKKLQHTSNLYYTEPQVKLAQMLSERTGLKKAFFANSGAEANEVAIKTARKYGTTKKGIEVNEIITLKNSFHGRTMATITATGQDNYHKDFKPFLDGFRYCEANNVVELNSLVNKNTCAIMIEIVQGEGGVVPLDKEFIIEVAKICKNNDVLFIVDEVQTGVGRTGKLFAYQHFDVNPDIVTFAKGIGGGLPIGGALFGEKSADILKPGDHGTTYGGNPVACAGAIAVLERINDEFLMALDIKGKYLEGKLIAMPNVKKITGMGMMLGAEINGKEANDVVKAALEEGLMILTAKDKIRLLPPLNITKEDLDQGLDILWEVLEK